MLSSENESLVELWSSTKLRFTNLNHQIHIIAPSTMYFLVKKELDRAMELDQAL